jgi:hypothetical protein
MKLSPLRKYRGPDYPTQEILAQHPELLRVLPRRWQNNAVVLGTLAGLLALMEQSTAQAGDKSSLHVAPVFEHGKGQGALGCIVVSPPVFLTEAEARDVIEEEAKKAGVGFAERGHKLERVPFAFLEKYIVLEDPKPESATTTTSDGRQVRTFKWSSNPEDRYRKKSPKQTREASRDVEVELTGWNSQKQIGYRFVTREDYKAQASDSISYYEKLPDGSLKSLVGPGIHTWSSVTHYDVRGAAQRFVRGLEKVEEPGTVGVFYDPAASASKRPSNPKLPPAQPQKGKEPSKEEKEALEEAQRKAWKEYREAYDATAKAESAEELRSQVRDFLAWLKAQGVI